MDERARVSHLLRRFGLGAGRFELERYLPLGFEGALRRLVEFGQVDDGFTVSPWQFATQDNGEVKQDVYLVAHWWALRFAMTQRPLQERLALFWHDHFAVDGEKVFMGPAMVDYVEGLRNAAAGRFRDILSAGVKSTAMCYFLDAGTNRRFSPNENLAREILELFTVGHGNHSERDVREAARCLTGWSIHYAGIGDDRPFEKIAEECARHGEPVFNFCEVPKWHDPSVKEVLGHKEAMDGDGLLDHLAGHPATAWHICTKLWEWFAYPSPDRRVVDSLVKAWNKSGGEIKPVLYAIARHPEFWSERCVRNRPKSPVDWTVALVRSLGIGPMLATLATKPEDPYTPVDPNLRKVAGGVHWLMAQQGLNLLYPPDVGGWQWGEAWLTTDNTLRRVNHAGTLFWGDSEDRIVAVHIAGFLKDAASPEEAVGRLLDILDADPTPEQRGHLARHFAKHGGLEALKTKDGAANVLTQTCQALFATPGYQLC